MEDRCSYNFKILWFYGRLWFLWVVNKLVIDNNIFHEFFNISDIIASLGFEKYDLMDVFSRLFCVFAITDYCDDEVLYGNIF